MRGTDAYRIAPDVNSLVLGSVFWEATTRVSAFQTEYAKSNSSLFKPALEEVPQWLHCVLCSVGSTAWILIGPDTILERRVPCRNGAIIRVDRGDCRSKWVDIVEVKRAFGERGVRETSLDRLIDEQDIRMLVQRTWVQDCVIGELVHIAGTIFGYGCKGRCIPWTNRKPDSEWSISGIVARLSDVRNACSFFK